MMIVAEISKNYIDGQPVTRPLLSEQFERAIAVNRERGYRLHSWRLSRVAFDAEINETIIAVFEKAQGA